MSDVDEAVEALEKAAKYSRVLRDETVRVSHRYVRAVLDTMARYRKALEHISDGKERGGMYVAIALEALGEKEPNNV